MGHDPIPAVIERRSGWEYQRGVAGSDNRGGHGHSGSFNFGGKCCEGCPSRNGTITNVSEAFTKATGRQGYCLTCKSSKQFAQRRQFSAVGNFTEPAAAT